MFIQMRYDFLMFPIVQERLVAAQKLLCFPNGSANYCFRSFLRFVIILAQFFF